MQHCFLVFKKKTRSSLANHFYLTSNTALQYGSNMYIYVAVNLQNQIFPGIPYPFRESGELFLGISEIDLQLFQVRLGQYRPYINIKFTRYSLQGFPGFSKQVRDSWKYPVPQIRCNIYTHVFLPGKISAEKILFGCSKFVGKLRE